MVWRPCLHRVESVSSGFHCHPRRSSLLFLPAVHFFALRGSPRLLRGSLRYHPLMLRDYLGDVPFDLPRLLSCARRYSGTLSACAVCFVFFGYFVHAFGSDYLFGGPVPSDPLLDLYDALGVTPAVVGFTPARYYAWLTGLFVHTGPLHLLANLVFLLPFGVLVERRAGTFWFWMVLLPVGALGVVAHCWAYPTTHFALVGASGSVSGLVGFVWVAVPFRAPVWSSRPPDRPVAFRAYLVLIAWCLFFALSVIVEYLGRTPAPVALVPHLVGLALGLCCGTACRLLDPLPVPADQVDSR